MPIKNDHRRFRHCWSSDAAPRISRFGSLTANRQNNRIISPLAASASARPPPCYRNQCSVNYYFSTIKSSLDQESEGIVSSPLSVPREQTITSVNNIDKSSSLNKATHSSSLLEHYESLIASGEVTRDPHQIRALRELDRLRVDCLKYVASPSFHHGYNGDGNANGDGNESGGWSLASLFSSWSNNSTTSSAAAAASSSSSSIVVQTTKEGILSSDCKFPPLPTALDSLKTYVTAQIVDYLGEEEATLIDFIMKELTKDGGCSTSSMLDEMKMVLDEDAEDFVVNLYRKMVP